MSLLLAATRFSVVFAIFFMMLTCEVCAEGNAEALLIVYPDYPINTDSFYGYTELAGHAGVLLIREDGLTKYYEFGRYDEEKRGQVVRRKISNAKIVNGQATVESLSVILRELSNIAGRNGRIRAAYFINMDFDPMNDFAAKLMNVSDPDNSLYDKNRKAYETAGYNCGHFAEAVVLKGHPKIDKPTIVIPLPVNIVDEYIEEGNAEILFESKTGELIIGKGDEGDAKE